MTVFHLIENKHDAHTICGIRITRSPRVFYSLTFPEWISVGSRRCQKCLDNRKWLDRMTAAAKPAPKSPAVLKETQPVKTDTHELSAGFASITTVPVELLFVQKLMETCVQRFAGRSVDNLRNPEGPDYVSFAGVTVVLRAFGGPLHGTVIAKTPHRDMAGAVSSHQADRYERVLVRYALVTG